MTKGKIKLPYKLNMGSAWVSFYTTKDTLLHHHLLD